MLQGTIAILDSIGGTSINYGTSTPTGGSDGDVYFQVDLKEATDWVLFPPMPNSVHYSQWNGTYYDIETDFGVDLADYDKVRLKSWYPSTTSNDIDVSDITISTMYVSGTSLDGYNGLRINSTTGKYEIFPNRGGDYRFEVKREEARIGEIVAIWQNVRGTWINLTGGEKYSAGENISIINNVISATDTNTDALADLTDVDLNNPTDGQVLKYDNAIQKWINSSGGGGSDVTITPTLSTGQKLADYTIDGASGAIYMPTVASGDLIINPSEEPTDTLTKIGVSSSIEDAYLANGKIATSAGYYITCPLDKTLVNGTYTVRVRDGSSEYNFEVTYSGSTITKSWSSGSNNYTLTITSTTAGMSYYSGSYRNIYCDIVMLIPQINVYSIGGINYSTDEQVIGTWIDGKPIYQKTFYTADLNYNTVRENKNVGSISGIDMVVSLTGILANASKTARYQVPFPTPSSGNLTNINYDYTNNCIYFSSTTTWSDGELYVTMQYTKTTD